MPLFLVVVPEPAAVSPYKETIERVFKDDYMCISSTVWAVYSNGIAKDVALKITGEEIKPGAATLIVTAVSGYWGIAQNSVWEWFASKLTAHVALK